MMITTKGQNNWNYRSGYQRVQRVPAPIQPMQRPGLFARVFGKAAL